jgi:hypothetical protein
MNTYERIDEINKGKPDTMTHALILVVVICAILFTTVIIVRTTPRPEILILSEKFVQGYNGEMLLFVDYTVGGIATNATFREHQMDKYNSLMKHLEKTGRVNR